METAHAQGRYTVRHMRGEQIISEEQFDNVVCTEGKNAMLDVVFAAATGWTATNYLGLISSVSYTGVAAGDTMASHAGWTEAGSANAPTFAARLAPTLAAASAGAKATSSTVNFTMTGAGTVKGCFLAIKTAAGVAPTSAIANTSGALWSAAAFAADKVVASGDVIQVTYSTSL